MFFSFKLIKDIQHRSMYVPTGYLAKYWHIIAI